MKIKFDFKSIKFRLWLYFLTLSLGSILIIWFFQIIFLNNNYEDMKISEVNTIASSITSSYQNKDESLTQNIQQLSIVNDFYVMMENNGSILLFSPEAESLVPVYRYKSELPHLKLSLTGEPIGASFSYKFTTGMDEYETLAYGSILDSSPQGEVFLYIFSPLYPVNSTIAILKKQFFNGSLLTVFVTFVLAYLFSRRISKPIKSMTVSAKKLGSGDYNVKFETDSYSEVNNLADTLNIAAYEMGMADTRQKDLVANVSHDLKTPLTMIKSYAEMIRDLSGDNPEKRNAHLQVIMDESERMNKLVSDMATISAMRSRDVALNKTYFDLFEVTASLLASYDIYVVQDGYDFQFSGQKESMVYADVDKIRQVISNLLSNAIKYCGDDKVVITTIRKIGKKYRLEVSDHGPGISQEEIPHIWDRYYKTSTNYVRPTTGTGLGLSIVKEILTLHKAGYGVVSKVGSGSTFWFELDSVKQPN